MKNPRTPKLKVYSLHKTYNNHFELFERYDKIYNIARRLGYKNAFTAWKANPNYTLSISNNNQLTKISKTKTNKN